MIPFANTWPYERSGKDIYIHECPYCGASNVRTNLGNDQLEQAKEQIKTYLIMPCCLEKMTIVEADEDYFWTNERLRK